jgi:hypothetical protein
MNVDPGLRNPTVIFTIGVKRISEVTDTMLGPAVFVIVNALLKKVGLPYSSRRKSAYRLEEIARQCPCKLL